MSTLEKTIDILNHFTEQDIEVVYQLVQLIDSKSKVSEENVSAFGIAHKYANSSLIEKEKGAFKDAACKKHSTN